MLISSVWRGLGRTYFIAGLLAGGAAAACLVSVIGSWTFQWWLPDDWRVGIAASAIVGATCFAPVLVRLRFAQNRRQVPEAIRRRGPRVGAFQFGVEMGTGARTFVTTAMPYALLVGVMLTVPPNLALAVGVGFGAGRALVPLLRSHDVNDVEWSEAFNHNGNRIWFCLNLAALAGLTAVVLRASHWM